MNLFNQMISAVGWAIVTSGLVYVIALRWSATQCRLPRWLEAFLNISSRRAERLFAILASSYTLFFSWLAIGYHLTLRKNTLDLSIYAQVLWNSLNGRLFENTLIPDASHYLGKTFAPILLAFVPFYALWSDPIVLIVIQVVAFGLGAFPIFWFARARLGNAFALVIALVYFLTPTVGLMMLAEFYEIWLVAPMLGLVLFFLLRRHYSGFLVSLGVTLLFKEEIAIIALAFGAFVFLVQRERKLGVALVLLGAAWGVLVLQYLVPFFRGTQSFYYFDPSSLGGGRYGYLGHNVPTILNTFITRPEVVWQAVTTPEKIQFTLHHLVPLAFVPLFGLEVAALALPTLGYTLLSQAGYQYDVFNQYRAPLLPILFFATIVGLERILKWRRGVSADVRARQLALVSLLLVASGSYWVQTSEYFYRFIADSRNYIPDAHSFLGHALARTIPHNATVIAQNELMIVSAHRAAIYEIPTLDYRQADYLIADKTRPWYQIHQGFWDSVLESGFFVPLNKEDGYIVAKRRVPEQRVNIRFGDQLTLLAFVVLPEGSLRGGQTLRPIIAWQAEKPIEERYVIQINLTDAIGRWWKSDAREPHNGALPTNHWTPGRYVYDQYHLQIDHIVPTGEYYLTARVYDASQQTALFAYDEQGKLLGEEITLATLKIQKSKANATASQLSIEQPLFVDMREMRFLGYVPPRTMISPGELLQIGVYWRAREKPRGDYIVAVQLREPSGRVAFEHTARPANNTYPTTEWDAGEVLLDWHDFHLPRDLAAGSYQIFVVLRDAATDTRVGETLISTLFVVK